MIERAIRALAAPVSGQSAAVFRIAYGFVGFIIAFRYVRFGWVGSLLIEPTRHFSYPGLAWIQPWPEPWMTIHVVAMAVAAVGVMVGYRYRLSLGAFLALFAYMELIDRTLYINHYYWIGLTALVLMLLPLHTVWSLDARRIGNRVESIPIGVIWVLRFQLGMVYVFAGLAKINPDWLLRGEPLATWLGARTDMVFIGSLLGHVEVAVLASWAGAIFDLTVVGWLLWKRTRLPGYIVLATFHGLTWVLFPSIGLFPLVMTLGTLVFFEPDWPTRLVSTIRRRPRVAAPKLDRLAPSKTFRIAAAVLALYAAGMVAMPLRDVANQNLRWDAAGYQFAWRVMLTEKVGSVDFIVTDPATDGTWIVDEPRGLTYRQVAVMSTDPGLIRSAALMVQDDMEQLGFEHVEVRADAYVSFNGLGHTRLLRPTVDLTVTTPESLLQAVEARP